MNREILFRAKEYDSNNFVFGFLASEHTIITLSPLNNTEEIVIKPETIGQYTGLQDLTGNKVFEGDILRFGKNTGVVCFGKYKDNYPRKMENYGFYVKDKYDIGGQKHKEIIFWILKMSKVIGNIYDDDIWEA